MYKSNYIRVHDELCWYTQFSVVKYEGTLVIKKKSVYLIPIL